MDQSSHASLGHRHQENNRIANRSALSERAAQGNFSQFNSLDLLLPWFGTRRTVVQMIDPERLEYLHSRH